MNIKTKTNLIKIIQKHQQTSDGSKLGKRIMRQVKLHNSVHEKEWKKIIFDEEEKKIFPTETKTRKKPKIKVKIDWEVLEKKIAEITEQWQRKQVEIIINQFLEEIKVSLKRGEIIALRNYFSLGIMSSKRRKGINPSILKKLKSPHLSWEEKTRLEAKKEILIPPQNRIRFKISSKLKREIN